MKKTVRTDIRRELSKRGFDDKGSSKHDTIVLDNDYLDGVDVGDLLDLMVQRREKFSRSDVGEKAAKENYDDAISAVEAIKAVIEKHLS